MPRERAFAQPEHPILDWPTWYDWLSRSDCHWLDEVLGYHGAAFESEDRRAWIGQKLGVDIGYRNAQPVSALTASLVGVAHAMVYNDGTWQPTEAGDRDGLPVITYPCIATSGRCYDIVAICARTGQHTWRRTGVVDMLYGLDDREIAPWECDPTYEWEDGTTVRLFRHTLEWIRAGRPAGSVVVLDWTGHDAATLLSRLDDASVGVICDDDDHAKEIRRRARPQRPPMKIKAAGTKG